MRCYNSREDWWCGLDITHDQKRCHSESLGGAKYRVAISGGDNRGQCMSLATDQAMLFEPDRYRRLALHWCVL